MNTDTTRDETTVADIRAAIEKLPDTAGIVIEDRWGQKYTLVRSGYEGKHYAIPPYRLGSESYVPRHAKPEDEWSL
jgi:hypothetical protein